MLNLPAALPYIACVARAIRICPNCRFQKGDQEARKYLVQPWQLFDVRAITAQAKKLRLNLFADKIHSIPVVYEEVNTLLLTLLCNERNEFA